MSGVATAIGVSSLVGAGASMYSANKAKGGAMYTPKSAYQNMNGAQQGQFDQLANNNAAYLNSNMQRINSGRGPEYAENMIASQSPYLKAQAKGQFMGRPGDRGGSVMGQAAQSAAMFGLNPKARMAQMNKSFMDYQGAQAGIDQQMNQMRFDASKSMANSLPGWMTGQQTALANANSTTGGTYMPGSPAADMSGLGSMTGSMMNYGMNQYGNRNNSQTPQYYSGVGGGNYVGGSNGGGYTAGAMNLT